MLSSGSHCVWSMGKNVCHASGSQCENMTSDSPGQQGQEQVLHHGVWRNLAELLDKEMSRGENMSYTLKYRRECAENGGDSVVVSCDVEVADHASIPERDAIIFLRPESRSWIAEFTVELHDCNNASVTRGLSILSNENLQDVRAQQWLQVEFIHSRQSGVHVYSLAGPGFKDETRVPESQCSGFKRYKVEGQNISLWRDSCWRDAQVSTSLLTTHFLRVAAVATIFAVVVVAFYALRLTLEAKALVMNMDKP